MFIFVDATTIQTPCALDLQLENGRHLEAFSIQLVILAILKQCLRICHVQAVAAAEGSPSETIKSPQSDKASPSSKHCFTSSDSPLPFSVSSEIEKEFLLSVEHAEQLAKDVGQVDGIVSLLFCCRVKKALLYILLIQSVIYLQKLQICLMLLSWYSNLHFHLEGVVLWVEIFSFCCLAVLFPLFEIIYMVCFL